MSTWPVQRFTEACLRSDAGQNKPSVIYHRLSTATDVRPLTPQRSQCLHTWPITTDHVTGPIRDGHMPLTIPILNQCAACLSLNVVLCEHIRTSLAAPPPWAWNRLLMLRLMRSTPVFKRSLKTFLFQTACSVPGSHYYTGQRNASLF